MRSIPKECTEFCHLKQLLLLKCRVPRLRLLMRIMFHDESRYIRICNITYLFECGGKEPALSPTSAQIQTHEKKREMEIYVYQRIWKAFFQMSPVSPSFSLQLLPRQLSKWLAETREPDRCLLALSQFKPFLTAWQVRRVWTVPFVLRYEVLLTEVMYIICFQSVTALPDQVARQTCGSIACPTGLNYGKILLVQLLVQLHGS